MPKLQIIKMDEEIEKITSNFPSRIPFEKKKPKKKYLFFFHKIIFSSLHDFNNVFLFLLFRL